MRSSTAQLGVDIGGTFTDAALESRGVRYSAKVLTTHDAPDEGVMAAARQVLTAAGLQFGDLGLVIHGTTLATNLLIERKGAPTGMLTTAGHRDALRIGLEHRFDLYDLAITLPEPLVPRALRLPVRERIAADGRVLAPLVEADIDVAARRFEEAGVTSVAVCFLHSYVDGAHERRAAAHLASRLPGIAITLSCEIAPEMREFERFSTACANAYVQPVIAGYLARLEARLRAEGMCCPLLLMLSGGGLTDVNTAVRAPVRLVESGPAGGAVFAAAAALAHGFDEVISFDMGGTTAKICLIEKGQPQTSRLFEVARAYRFKKGSGLPLRIPVVEMVEIGAGGGSLARVDTLGRVQVGPDSAGSQPGPACYGRGGVRPAVTDADLLLGRLDAKSFAGGRMQLDAAAARAAMEAHVAAALGGSAQAAAATVAEVVEEAMAAAARVHAVESGKRLADRVIVAFGGAAPLHVAAVAKRLRVRRFLVPPGAGVGSAIGFLRAAVAYEVARSYHVRLDGADLARIDTAFDILADEGRRVVEAAEPGALVAERRSAMMRYVGQGHEIAVDLPQKLAAVGAAALKSSFETRYREVYGRTIATGQPEILSISVLASAPPPDALPQPSRGVLAPDAPRRREVFDSLRFAVGTATVHARGALEVGAAIVGPALVEEDETTTFVPEGWTATLLATGAILCEAIDA
jgi:N-methylhydantoinase A